jgi:hypothetical protein
MTHFEDGPAKDKTLMLKRSPLYLRVVEVNGAWDALDQLDDRPRPEEKLYAYERVGKVGMVHINTGRKNHGGLFPMATYRFISDQPDDADMRDSERWRQRCRPR